MWLHIQYPPFPSSLYLSCSSALVPITVSFLFSAGGGTAAATGGDEAVVCFLFFSLFYMFGCRSGFGLRGVDRQGTQTGEMGCVI